MADLLISDLKGNIFSDPSLEATGMKGGHMYRLDISDMIKMPGGSRLFMLPSRAAVGYNKEACNIMPIDGAFPVAAFLAPGYTATYSAAYIASGSPKQLPLFSYAAACMRNNEVYVTAIQVDKDKRHDCRFIDMDVVRKNTVKFATIFKGNRLFQHLKRCALDYGCPNAQNLFLNRYEAPLPTSPQCNASCPGCISFQPGKRCPASQPRIKFVPTAEEVCRIALFHIGNVKEPIVSFGQGCEGEPLLQEKLIERSIKLIRGNTSRGTIHINTNGSRPDALKRLLDAGLDSVRISMNSAREACYMKYYRPRAYKFKDVMRSIITAKEMGAFVSINYLTMPGFTDRADEHDALKHLVKRYGIDMIQWRNLNYDPIRYFEEMDEWPDVTELLGVKYAINSIKKEFPRIRIGYFNPAMLCK